ncbi:MAG: alpha-L-fucosidase [bacterium]|nr:alpha-L-fucosidase [bacterium]
MNIQKLLIVFLIILLITPAVSQTQESIDEKAKRLQWFEDAKLGIFIHWGIYAVNGIDESWSFYNEYIPYNDYMDQLSGFTASKYDPSDWADLIKESGAKYAVLTSKHHDGVALWDTKYNDLSVVKKTPAGRDLIGPFSKAMRKKGLKVGLYFSHLDWSHQDYPHFTKTNKRYDNDDDRWNRFLEFRSGQIKEITTQFKPDLLWFDGDWDYNADQWKSGELKQQILDRLPNVIINSRLNGFGDYDTPEQGLPITRPQSRWWELCMTMNDSWGYQHNDSNYKTPNQIIRIFVDCLSLGGNLLLDIGPKEDGTIPDEQVRILKELGRWTNKHKEAVYSTRAGISKDYFYGPTTLSENKELLYLYIIHRPDEAVVLKGIKNKINRIWVVGNGTKLSWKVMMKQYWSDKPGLVYIDIPEKVLDEQVTVLAVLLDGPIDLYK